VSKIAFAYSEFIKLRSAKPFRPFVVELKSGESFDVLERMWCGGNSEAGTLGVCHPRTGCRLFKVSAIDGLRLMSDYEIDQSRHLRDARKRA
jgi:hypothetical protein